MSISVSLIMENSFNAIYLLTIWILTILMIKNKKRVEAKDKDMANRFTLAIFLLAFGDSFHVGARILSAIIGTENATVMLTTGSASLLGLGMMATAYTMTGFYMVFAEARTKRAGKEPDIAFWVMQVLLSLRLIIMAIPGNNWEQAIPPYGMGLVRNLPLAIAGFLMAYLFIYEGIKDGDKSWRNIGWAMVASYGFYTPVILFAKTVPMLGLLMIPKTVAYVVMGLIIYKRYWKKN